MNQNGEPTTGAVVGWMVVFVVLGAPLVYLIWRFLNHSLAGRFAGLELIYALLGAAGLWVLMRFVAARARIWNIDER